MTTPPPPERQSEAFIKPERIGRFYVTQEMKDYAASFSDDQKRYLLMGPVVSFIAEYKPYVVRIRLSRIAKMLGVSDRVVRMKQPDFSGADLRCIQVLTQLGLYAEHQTEWLYDRDVEPDPEDKTELETLRRYQSGYSTRKTWRWTEKGAAVAALLSAQNETQVAEGRRMR